MSLIYNSLRFTIVSVFFISFLSGSLIAQKGFITGTVTDKNNKETLIGANVVIKGTVAGATSDLQGNYSITNLQPGKYTLQVSYVSYKPLIIENIKVTAGQETIVDIALEEESTFLEGVTVTERKKTDTDISVISTIKSSSVMVTGVSKQQISKSMDKNAAEVIKRVPGVTIINGRFLVVRGLIDRYNTVWINGTTTPSFESDKRSFSFDMIPSSSLDRMMIYKTPAPEFPADFSGAVVQIFTRNQPDEDMFSLSYKTGFSEGTTFSDFQTYEGGKTDWLGFDDGTRKLPEGFVSTGELENLHNWDDTGLPPDEMQALLAAKRTRLQELGRSFNQTWDSKKITAPVDNGIEIELARRIKIGKIQAANITSLIYKNEYDYNKVFKSKFLYNEEIGIIDTNFNYIDKYFQNEVILGILHNWSFQIGRNTLLEFRNLINQVGNNQYSLRTGYDFYRESYTRSHELGYMSRFTYSGQLGIKQEIDELSTIDIVSGFSYSLRRDPDIRRVYGTLNDDTTSIFFGQYGVEFLSDATPELNGRLFLNLDERIYNIGSNYQIKMPWDHFQPVLKAGIYIEHRNRQFSARNLGYVKAKSNDFNDSIRYIVPYSEIFSMANINYPYGLMLDEKTLPTDSYQAESKLYAAYAGFLLPVTIRLNLYTGIRMEASEQNLFGFYKETQSNAKPIVIDTLNLFPSANLSWDLSEKTKIRVAYGMTINRPEFREIAPYSYYDFITASQMYGNDSLKNCYIHNYDLRFEWYPSYNEMITIGGFYKQFIHPIENTQVAVNTDKWTFQPQNAKNATALGAEIDVKKSFGNMNSKTRFGNTLRNFTVVMNAALIKSEVEENKLFVRDEKRAMQGQSPYIVNTGVYYENPGKTWMVNILYNIIGKRIIWVGDPNTPHTYEMPRNLLEVSLVRNIGKHIKIKAGIKDILNEEIRYTQFITLPDNNGKATQGIVTTTDYEMTLMSFRPGHKISFGFTYTF